MTFSFCECEHIAHFEKGRQTPCGNPGHAYGVEFAATFLQPVSTDFGAFNVCKDCARDCLARYAETV